MAYSRLSPNDSRTKSSVVTSLAFRRGGQVAPETKDGAAIYHGDAAYYHEWEFKTRMKLTSGTKEQFPTRMAQVVNGLRGEALAIAMQITHTSDEGSDFITRQVSLIQAE